MKNTNKSYYLYRHIRLDKNEPFYIGVGTTNAITTSNYENYKRAFSKQRNGWWKIIVEKSNYEIDILIESENEDFIYSKEIEFIKLYGRRDLGRGTLVNLTDGGKGILGNKTKKKSFKNKGLSLIERFKLKYGEIEGNIKYNVRTEKIRNSRLGRQESETSKKKRSEIMKMHWKNNPNMKPPSMSKEAKELMRSLNKGKRKSIVTEFKPKAIYQLDDNYNIVKEYVGALEASLSIGCSVSLITNCVRGRMKKAKNYHWCYIKDFEIIKQKWKEQD